MKTIIIRLPDVETAMLVEVQKVNKAYRDLQGLLINQIQTEYQKTPKGGDFQERCHSWAATQAARINVNSRASSFSSGGLLIHTSSGWRQQRVLWLQRVGLARRAAS